MKENKSIVINDQKEIEEIQDFFDKQEEKISKKVYVSVTEERARTIKLFCKKRIKFNLEKTREAFLEIIIKDLHPNLTMDQIKENAFYKGSNRINKVAFKITKFKNDEITVYWYNNDQKFIKDIQIKQSFLNKNKILISYSVFVTGMNSIETYFEKRIRSVYLKRESIAFKINILKLKEELNLVDKNKADKLINKMMNFANKIY